MELATTPAWLALHPAGCAFPGLGTTCDAPPCGLFCGLDPEAGKLALFHGSVLVRAHAPARVDWSDNTAETSKPRYFRIAQGAPHIVQTDAFVSQ